MDARSPLISRRRRNTSTSARERTMGYGSTALPKSSTMNHNDHGLGAPEREHALLNNQPSANEGSWSLESPCEAIMLTSTILNAMAAGIIFIFSNTIMPTLATLDPDVGINVMNTINTIIVNPLFVLIFFGGLISVYPTIVMWTCHANDNNKKFFKQAKYYALASTLTYFFGQFLITLTQNVPRNNALLEVDSTSDNGANYWTEDYLKSWVAWNTARGVFALVAAVLGGLSLFFMERS